MIISNKFRDTRTGEIVTQVPISEIAHFDEIDTITLTCEARGWVATYSGGPQAKRMTKEFGTRRVVTAFTRQAAADDVLRRITELNPDCVVELAA